MVAARPRGARGGGDASGPSVESVLRSDASDLGEGVDVIRGTVFVELLLTTAVTNSAIGVTLAILPAFGDGLGGPAMYGLLLGALGVGRLVGSVVGHYVEYVPYGRVLATQGLGAACWVAAAYAPTPALAVVLFGLAWIPGATLPLGSLVGGAVAEVFGTKTTMALAASGFGFTAAYVLLRPRRRRLPSVVTAEPDDFDLQTDPVRSRE